MQSSRTPSPVRKQHIDSLLTGDHWRRRRLVGGLILFFLMGNVEYIIIRGTDTALYQQIAITMIGAIVACFGSYVFGATWDDSSKRKFVADVDSDAPAFNPADVEGGQ